MRIYIIEDEPPAAEKLRIFLLRAEPDSEICVYHDGRRALEALEHEPMPEIMFMDIEMPGLTGLEVIERLPSASRPQIIITSAYEKYAIQGFQLSVTDYLLKPYSYLRFVEALTKARETLRLRALESGVQTSTTQAPSLTIRTDLRTEVIDIDTIIYIEAVKDYIRIVTPTRRMLTQQTLTAIEAQLPPGQFCRIHRSYLIGAAHITAYDRNCVTLTGGTQLAIGRTYKAAFNDLVKTRFESGVF